MKIVNCHTTDSKPVKQEVNSTVMLPPLVFPGLIHVSKALIQGITNRFLDIFTMATVKSQIKPPCFLHMNRAVGGVPCYSKGARH